MRLTLIVISTRKCNMTEDVNKRKLKWKAESGVQRKI